MIDQSLSINSKASRALNKNSTAVDTITTNGESVTFSLSDGADQDQFGIDEFSASTIQLEVEIPAVTVDSRRATSASDFNIIPFSGGSGTTKNSYPVETIDEL